MSILSTTAAIVAATAVAAYGLGQFTGRTIETRIEIAAPPAAVWTELTAIDAYPDWNPFVKHLSGTLEAGQRLQVTVQPAGKSAMDFSPEVLVAETGQELRWVGRLGFRGILDGEHYFLIEETADGTTIFHHGENFTGMLAHVLFPLIGKDTEAGFDAMNRALKDRVEAAL